MNTKTPIVQFFGRRLPEFVFDAQSRPNLVFRRSLPGRLFECIAIQRDSKANGLAPNLAVTYCPSWRGEPAFPLGLDAVFAELRQNSRNVQIIESWYFYEPTVEGLNATLEQILADYHQLAVPFFARAQRELLDDRLLQTALREAATIPAESRTGLRESIESAGYLLANCNHPAFLALKDRIRAACTPDIPEEQRMRIAKLAYDTLVLV